MLFRSKRIEAGREMMIGGICESPLTLKRLTEWRDALLEGKMLLRDVIDLEATMGAEEAIKASDAEDKGEADPDADAKAKLNGVKWNFWIPSEGLGAHVSFFSPRAVATVAPDLALRFEDAIPIGRYRGWAGYAAEHPNRGFNLRTIVGYLFHRTALSGGKGYFFRKPAGGAR